MILDGKAIADKLCADLKTRCDVLKEKNIQPILTIITSGDDAASKVYVRNKVKRCGEIGIEAEVEHHDHLERENLNGHYGPLIVQEPITGSLTHWDIASWMPVWWDVDGFSNRNIGLLATGAEPFFLPCTPAGIMRLLQEYHVPLEGKSALVIGRSNIVGRPMAMLLEQANATVTVAHSKTPEVVLYEAVKNADVIVSAVGKCDLLTYDRGNMVSEYSIDWSTKTIVDVGMNRDENGKLCGDIPESLKQQCAFYTPTPGGTGPMTVAMLMKNTIKFYERTAERS